MKPKLCFVLTNPFALNAFLRPHLERLADIFDITVCVNAFDSKIPLLVPSGIKVEPLLIIRDIGIWADIRALFSLFIFLRKHRFDLIYSLTPKAGLLAMLAAWLARVGCRVHCFTGQVWASKQGVQRWLLKKMDQLIAVCATHLLTDGPSQRQYLIKEGIVPSEKIRVVADGSMAGVDIGRFKPNPAARKVTRISLGLEEQAKCLLYVGRLKRDKGVADLIAAFNRLKQDFSDLHLLLVGPDEDGLDALCTDSRIHRVGYTTTVEAYMAAADIFCLPSYREGFGSVLIEASATGIPVITSRIYGTVDAIVEGRTALLHEPGNVDDLTLQIRRLIENESLRLELGKAGINYVSKLFSQDRVTQAMSDFLCEILAKRVID